MSALVYTLVDIAKHHKPSNEAVVLSNVFGSVSLACWIILLVPQLVEQYQQKSADGLAIGFITAWFCGDLANLFGALWGDLRPNVILLALWFCFSDGLLISSYFYYSRRWPFFGASRRASVPVAPREDARARASDAEAAAGVPVAPAGSAGHSSEATPLLAAAGASDTTTQRPGLFLSTVLPLLVVAVLATISYFVSDQTPDDKRNSIAFGPAVLGYVSAAFYVFARIPQILRNHERRSVEGLSIGFFVLSIIGNLTYGAQILVYRQDAKWRNMYMPWLIGSLGTIIEDVIIFLQFFIYRRL